MVGQGRRLEELNPDEAHGLIADAILTAVEVGVPGTIHALDRTTITEVDPAVDSELKALGATREELTAELEIAKKWRLPDKEKELTGEIQELDDRVDELTPRREVARTVGATSSLPAALAYLCQCVTAPLAFIAMLREVISAELAGVSVTPAFVEIGLIVTVTTDDGPLRLEPIWVRIPNHHELDVVPTENRDAEFARAYLLEARSLEEIASTFGGWHVVVVERKIREWLEVQGLVPSEGMRAAIMDCKIPEDRIALGCHVFGDPLPPGMDRRYAAKAVKRYTSKRPWINAWAGDTHLRRRAAVVYVAAHDAGEGVVWDDVCHALQVPSNLMRIMLDDCAPGGRSETSESYDYGATLERTEAWGHASGQWPAERRRVRVRRCPHGDCRAILEHVIRTPVTAGDDIACPTCHRLPSDAKMILPDSIFEFWVGPFGTKASGKGKLKGQSGTVLGQPVSVPAPWRDGRW